MKKLVSIFTVFAILLGGTLFSFPVQSTAAGTSFRDIPSTYYAKTKIDYLVEKGVISGYADGTFRPNQVVTRGQFAAFVARALKLDSQKRTFKDVPRNNSLYEEISNAAEAGIILGYADGTFKPNNPVKREEIAAMIDRAMKLRGYYTKTATLSYSDKTRIGGFATESVKKLTAYSVMGAISGTNQFQPKADGTRVDTVVTIYNMLSVINKISSETNPTKMSYAELVYKYGQHNIYFRSRTTKEIYKFDMIHDYFTETKKYVPNINTYINEYISYGASDYLSFYPSFEVISYNNRAFRDSKMYKGEISTVQDDILPRNPTTEGKFLIDLHVDSTDFALYLKDGVKVIKMTTKPYTKNGRLMVEADTLFRQVAVINNYIGGITIDSVNKVDIKVNSNSVKVNGIEKKLSTNTEMVNNKLMVPVLEISQHLGLDIRTYKGINLLSSSVQRIDISNQELLPDFVLN